MAINKKLLHFKTFANFNSQKLSANEENTSYTIGVDGAVTSGAPVVRYESICWIKDTKQMWTHGQLYDCNPSGVASSDKYVIEDFTLEDIYDIGITDGTIQFPSDSIYNAIVQGKTIAIDCGYAGGGQAIAVTSVIDDFGYLYFIDAYNKKEVFLQIEPNSQEIPFEISEHITSETIDEKVSTKQDTLVSGTNIKTINGNSILGSGNLTISPSTPILYVSATSAATSIPMNTETVVTMVSTTSKTFTLNTNSAVTNPAQLTTEQKWSLVFGISASLSSAPSITFNTGAIGTLLWANGTEPTFEVGKYYEVSFLNMGGVLLGVCGTFSASE